jgi:hypothetical protein
MRGRDSVQEKIGNQFPGRSQRSTGRKRDLSARADLWIGWLIGQEPKSKTGHQCCVVRVAGFTPERSRPRTRQENSTWHSAGNSSAGELKKRRNLDGGNKIKERNQTNCRDHLFLRDSNRKSKHNRPDPDPSQKEKRTTQNNIHKQIFQLNLTNIYTTTTVTTSSLSFN